MLRKAKHKIKSYNNQKRARGKKLTNKMQSQSVSTQFGGDLGLVWVSSLHCCLLCSSSEGSLLSSVINRADLLQAMVLFWCGQMWKGSVGKIWQFVCTSPPFLKEFKSVLGLCRPPWFSWLPVLEAISLCWFQWYLVWAAMPLAAFFRVDISYFLTWVLHLAPYNCSISFPSSINHKPPRKASWW